jgi:hypothetical protein
MIEIDGKLVKIPNTKPTKNLDDVYVQHEVNMYEAKEFLTNYYKLNKEGGFIKVKYKDSLLRKQKIGSARNGEFTDSNAVLRGPAGISVAARTFLYYNNVPIDVRYYESKTPRSKGGGHFYEPPLSIRVKDGGMYLHPHKIELAVFMYLFSPQVGTKPDQWKYKPAKSASFNLIFDDKLKIAKKSMDKRNQVFEAHTILKNLSKKDISLFGSIIGINHPERLEQEELKDIILTRIENDKRDSKFEKTIFINLNEFMEKKDKDYYEIAEEIKEAYKKKVIGYEKSVRNDKTPMVKWGYLNEKGVVTKEIHSYKSKVAEQNTLVVYMTEHTDARNTLQIALRNAD